MPESKQEFAQRVKKKTGCRLKSIPVGPSACFKGDNVIAKLGNLAVVQIQPSSGTPSPFDFRQVAVPKEEPKKEEAKS